MNEEDRAYHISKKRRRVILSFFNFRRGRFGEVSSKKLVEKKSLSKTPETAGRTEFSTRRFSSFNEELVRVSH